MIKKTIAYFNKYKLYILLILILSLSAYLRFHRLGDLYVFNLDEEYQATYAWTEVLNPHPIWIGLIASALEFYIGPYVVYLTAILLSFSKGDPIITAYFAAFLGVITTAVIFFVGKRIFNLTPAYSGNLTSGTQCMADLDTCFEPDSYPAENAKYSSCRAHNDLNSIVHSVGFGPITSCSFANRTLQAVADCGNGTFYSSSNASELKFIYNQIAQSIISQSYSNQAINIIINPDHASVQFREQRTKRYG